MMCFKVICRGEANVQYMIYIHRFPEIRENVLNNIPRNAKVRELDAQNVLCIVGDREIRTKTVDDIKRSLDSKQRCYILPVKCMIETASLIELVFHNDKRVLFTKSTHD